jgi:thiamine-phosphate pyrophosphorylase
VTEPQFSSRSPNQSAARILDANCNRATEALRTLEEICRFAIDESALTAMAKALRHRVARECESILTASERTAQRDTPGDVGTRISTPSEATRSTIHDIASAAAGRLQESVRCLEEFSKLIAPNSAATFETIRYESYELGKQVLQRIARDVDFLRTSRLYVLADCKLPIVEFQQRIRLLSDNHVPLIQIRDKQRDSRELLAYANAAMQSIHRDHTRIIINDRLDIAMACGADGVHLGQEDLPIRTARQILPSTMWIGISTHTLDQAKEAESHEADYIGCGPTFPSQTKSFEQFAGPEFLRQVADSIRVPAFAIGGIQAATIDEVIATSIHGAAVGQAIWNADSIPTAVDQLNRWPR